MLRQEELAFLKAISTIQPTQALLKDLRTALSTRRKKKTVVSTGSHGTTLSGGPKASQRSPALNRDKHKANWLVNPGDSTEPAKRCPAPGAGSAPPPALTSVPGEQAA
jgi:hypothetical protein